MMEVLHDVAWVKLIPPDWVTKKGRKIEKAPDQMESSTCFLKCPSRSMELRVRLEKRIGTFFSKILMTYEGSRLG